MHGALPVRQCCGEMDYPLMTQRERGGVAKTAVIFKPDPSKIFGFLKLEDFFPSIKTLEPENMKPRVFFSGKLGKYPI